jgi:hypothetical protein
MHSVQIVISKDGVFFFRTDWQPEYDSVPFYDTLAKKFPASEGYKITCNKRGDSYFSYTYKN